jgi:opacity protein-like surface antigen
MTMTRKALIALAAAAAAAVTVGFAAQAQAKPHFNIDFDINLGAPLYNGGYYGYDDVGYDEDVCGYQIVKRWKWNYSHTHKFVTYKKVWVCN